MKLNLDYLMNGCTLTELAQCYFPDVHPNSALRGMHRWLQKRPGLLDELTEAGYTERGKQRLTPKMVRIILHHLGEPG